MSSFYKRPQWKRKREAILKRDDYLCRECKRYGKTTTATIVHHIIPLAWCLVYKIAFALASINLVSLCSKCHGEMHNKTNDKLTVKGLAWVKRMGEFGREWIVKYVGDW